MPHEVEQLQEHNRSDVINSFSGRNMKNLAEIPFVDFDLIVSDLQLFLSSIEAEFTRSLTAL